jgi:6-phosphogluconolactonase (cycloisomerase 2 family)
MSTLSRRLRLAALSGAAAAALLATSGSASASATNRAVFVQTDNPSGNQIVVYDRAVDGTLTAAGTYGTGGLGGTLEGSVTDHLASQASLTYDRQNGLLYAVNAGSNTISVFAVLGDRLALREVLPSGGSFPVSVAVSNDVVYVLNGLQGASLQGFRVESGRLVPIAGSGRALGLNPSATPQFVNTPGQVAFSPSGSQLIVTTKANGNNVDVFRVNPLGRLSTTPVVNPLPGTVPFAVTFDRQQHLLVTEAAAGALASFELKENGAIAQLDVVGTGQKATCWIVDVGTRFFTSNTASGSLSGFDSSVGGQLLTLVSTTATDAGTTDAAAPSGGRFLYVQAGISGIVDEFAVAPEGALNKIGSVVVPGAVGGEGIVAP